jgi:hypothetical protein
MQSIRDRIVDAAIAAINTGAPAGMPKADDSRMEPYKPEELPSINVFELLEEDSNEAHDGRWGPLLERVMTLRVEMRTAGDPPRKALDAMYCWVAQQLGNQQFGRLCDQCIESRHEWQNAAADQPYTLLLTDFRISFSTLKGDPTAST